MTIYHAICVVDVDVPDLQSSAGEILGRVVLQCQVLDVCDLRVHLLADFVHVTELNVLLAAVVDLLVAGGDVPGAVPALPNTVVAVVAAVVVLVFVVLLLLLG